MSADMLPAPRSLQGREEIQEDDMFTALEKIQQERLGGSMNSSQSSDETVRMGNGDCTWCGIRDKPRSAIASHHEMPADTRVSRDICQPGN
jgi:hypothetical protein